MFLDRFNLIVIISLIFLFAFQILPGIKVWADVEQPSQLQYVYEFLPAPQIGSSFPDRPVQTYLILADPAEACEPLRNYLDVEDHVVLVDRGECAFLEKVIMAEQAGARMVLITDTGNATEGFVDMIHDGSARPKGSIPAGFLPGNNGKRFRDYLTYKAAYIKLSIPYNFTSKGIREVLNKPPWELW